MNRRIVAAVVVAVVVVMGVVVTRHHGGTARVAPASPATSSGVDGVEADGESSTTTSPPVEPTTSTTVAPLPINTDLGATDRLEQTQPLVHVLPHETTHYKIDYHVDGDRLVLTITLLAILNHDYQRATYQAQLRQYKSEALDFLRAQGQDPGAYSISYQPPEAAGL